MSKATIWTWRHGSINAHPADGDWLRMFRSLEDSDDCAVDGVEVDGVWIDRDDVWKMPEYIERERASREQSRAWVERTYDLVTIELKHPVEDEWAAYDLVPTEEAEAVCQALAERFGDERVRMRHG